MKEIDDEYGIKYSHYANAYKTELESLKLVYDEDKDGAVSDGEENSTPGAMRWLR